MALVTRLALAATAFMLMATAAAADPSQAGAVVIRRPGAADAARVDGTATLRVLARTGEHIRQVDLDSSSGNAVYDAAALRAVRRWRQIPAPLGDSAEPEWLLVRVVFAAPLRTIRSASR
jgi:TonB family protein